MRSAPQAPRPGAGSAADAASTTSDRLDRDGEAGVGGDPLERRDAVAAAARSGRPRAAAVGTTTTRIGAVPSGDARAAARGWPPRNGSSPGRNSPPPWSATAGHRSTVVARGAIAAASRPSSAAGHRPGRPAAAAQRRAGPVRRGHERREIGDEQDRDQEPGRRPGGSPRASPAATAPARTARSSAAREPRQLQPPRRDQDEQTPMTRAEGQAARAAGSIAVSGSCCGSGGRPSGPNTADEARRPRRASRGSGSATGSCRSRTGSGCPTARAASSSGCSSGSTRRSAGASRQRLDRHEHVGDERDREEDREDDLLGDLDGRHGQAEPDAQPGHREREQQQQPEAREQRRRSPVWTVQPTTRPDSISTIRMPRVVDDVRERSARSAPPSAPSAASGSGR